MVEKLATARAFRFRLRNPGLFRIATAAGQQFEAGCLEASDWKGIPPGAIVFVRIDSAEGPLIAGRVVANTLEPGRPSSPADTAGLTLDLSLAGDSEPVPYLIKQRRIVTAFLALEQFSLPTL